MPGVMRPFSDAIAIVGVSCRLPGGADNPDALWELLLRGGETWSPVPADRFNEAAFYHANPDDPNGTNNHRGGHFLSGDMRDFDHAFFRLSPQQAVGMDPQQRILLEVVYEALESAGWPRERLVGSRTAVCVAAFATDFDRNVYRDPLDMPTYYLTGVEIAILANRISYVFDLRGPSFTVDTGCSGGFVALHQACQSLRDGEADAAIVAAPNLTLGPDHHIGMSNLHLVSGSGRSFPFDSRGDGYGRGEGFVALALKRLDDALRDRDPIRAVIRSSAVNHDGFTAPGITYPNSLAQADLIRMAYARAQLRPYEVAYVEAHGTGTSAGDTQELVALADVFTGPGRSSLPLYVGSIKGNVGHSENTSGLSSLLKAALILDRQIIPPVAGFSHPKPGLPLEHIQIPTEAVPWPQADGITPRISINSFGFGGTNAHVILEGAPHSPSPLVPTTTLDKRYTTPPRLFVLSANSQVSLKAMAEAYCNWLDQHPETPLQNLSYTLCHRRSALPWRFSCVAADRPSLVSQFRQATHAVSPTTVKPVSSSPDTDIVLVFTGQGAQWAGMGRSLLREESATSPPSPFRASILVSRDILRELGATWDLEAELRSAADDEKLAEHLGRAEFAQPATTALQIALVALLRAQGVRPSVVVGHSSGEFAAAYAAGQLSHRNALRVAFHRHGMSASASAQHGALLPRGAMMAVGLGELDVGIYTADLKSGVAGIACVNSPSSVTISGDADAIDEIAARLEAAQEEVGRIFHRRLLVDTAYHSYQMRAVAEEYRRRLHHLDLDLDTDGPEDKEIDMVPNTGDGNNGITFISSVTGAVKSSDFGSDYWTENLVSPVRFYDAMQTLARTRHAQQRRRMFIIEVGPHSALAGPVRQCLAGLAIPTGDFDYHPALRRGVDAVASVLVLAGRLFERGIALDFDAISCLTPESNTAVVVPDLPTYAWDHGTKHWYESRISREYRMRREPYHDLLGVRVTDATSREPRWRHMVGLATLPWLAHHVVDGLATFPGSGYLCMAVEALMQVARERCASRPELETVVLRRVSFSRALVIPDAPRRTEMQLSFRMLSDRPLSFTFNVSALTDGEWYDHCTGVVEGLPREGKEGEASVRGTDDSQKQTAASCGHITDGIDSADSADSTVLTTQDLYAGFAAAGNVYGPTFAGIRSLILANDASRTTATVAIPDVAAVMPAQHQAPHLIHPATLDILLHTQLPMVARRLGLGTVMPIYIEEMLLAPEQLPREPGSNLSVSAVLVSSHFRSAHADLSVTTSDGTPVVSAVGVEMVGLGLAARVHEDGEDSPKDGICSELAWGVDSDYMRIEDLSSPFGHADLVDHICFKRSNLSVLEIGTDQTHLCVSFLRAVDAHGYGSAALASYDFVYTSPGPSGKAREQLRGMAYPVRFHDAHDVGGNPSAGFQELERNGCDVVLASAVESLSQASTLVKPDGVVLMVLDQKHAAAYETQNPTDDWHAVLRSVIPDTLLNVQLAFFDAALNSAVVMCRPARSQLAVSGGRDTDTTSTHMPPVQILTRPACQSASPEWIEFLETGLRVCGAPVSLGSLDSEKDTDTAADSSICVVVDHQPEQSILSDPHYFGFVTKLLSQPARVIWLSPDDPPSMHQITGVARTAHAENDHLRLVTIHADPDALKLQGCAHARLFDVVAGCLKRLAGGDAESHREREYRVSKDGQILVPRLYRSAQLSRAISGDNPDVHKYLDVEFCSFTGASRPLVLSPRSAAGQVVFLDDSSAATAEPFLADNAIEIVTRAVGFSSAAAKLCEYVGTVARVGAAVISFSPGDRVVTLGPAVAASHLRVPSAHASQLPPSVEPHIAAALFRDVMAACHALHGLARLPQAGIVLIHGALGNAGRAAIAVARSVGASIMATAANESEASLLTDWYGIPTDSVLIARPSLHRQLPRAVLVNELDAIIQVGTDLVPREALTRLGPFGCLIILATEAPTPRVAAISTRGRQQPEMPHKPNVTIYKCDIGALVQARPDVIPGLVSHAAIALKHLPEAGLDICVRDIAHTAEAMRLIDLGICSKVALQVSEGSLVPAAVPLPLPGNDWSIGDVSYIVAGGLGDLGRRFLFLLARRGAKYLVTLSRRGIRAEEHHVLQTQLDKVQPGCRLFCLTCDLTSEVSVQDAAASLVHMGVPPVRGIIQSAAVLQDCPLASMRHCDFLAASRVKVVGTLALERAFSSPHLKFFLSLSSAVNVVGASGQANYNAGNSVQDAMPHVRRGTSACHFVSLNIGWIADAVATVDNHARLVGLRRAGLRPISPDELSRYFDHVIRAIMAGNCQLAQSVIGFDAASLSHATAHNGTIHSPMFSHVRGVPTPSRTLSPSSAGASSAQNFDQVAAGGDLKATANFIAGAVISQLAQLVAVDVASVDPHRSSIPALGLDSLGAIELRNAIAREFDAPLQSSELLTDQSIYDFAQKVVARSRRVPSHSGIDRRVNEEDRPEIN